MPQSTGKTELCNTRNIINVLTLQGTTNKIQTPLTGLAQMYRPRCFCLQMLTAFRGLACFGHIDVWVLTSHP